MSSGMKSGPCLAEIYISSGGGREPPAPQALPRPWWNTMWSCFLIGVRSLNNLIWSLDACLNNEFTMFHFGKYYTLVNRKVIGLLFLTFKSIIVNPLGSDHNLENILWNTKFRVSFLLQKLTHNLKKWDVRILSLLIKRSKLLKISQIVFQIQI